MRRVGYLALPLLRVQRIRLEQPVLATCPLLIGAERVIEADERCLEAGVRPGMAMRAARDLLPSACICPPETHRDVALFERVLEALDRVSDGIEPDGLAGAWFRPVELPERRLVAMVSDGLAAALGLQVRIGLAARRMVARIAAGQGERGEIVPAGDEAAYLAPLPLSLLPLSPHTIERLRLLGVTAIGQLAALPLAPLQRRFGREIVAAHRLACGQDDTPLSPRRAPPSLTRQQRFEPPVEHRAPLLAAARTLIEECCHHLEEQGKYCRTLRLQVEMEDGGSVGQRVHLRGATARFDRLFPVV